MTAVEDVAPVSFLAAQRLKHDLLELCKIIETRHAEPFVLEMANSLTQSMNDLLDLSDGLSRITPDYLARLSQAETDLLAIQRRHEASSSAVDDQVLDTPRLVAVTVDEAADTPAGVGSVEGAEPHTAPSTTHHQGGDA